MPPQSTKALNLSVPPSPASGVNPGPYREASNIFVSKAGGLDVHGVQKLRFHLFPKIHPGFRLLSYIPGFKSGSCCWVLEISPSTYRPMPYLVFDMFVLGSTLDSELKLGAWAVILSFKLSSQVQLLWSTHGAGLVRWAPSFRDGHCPAMKSLPTLDNSHWRRASSFPLKIAYLPLQPPYFLFLHYFPP